MPTNISVSKKKCFEGCKLQFKYQYIDHIKPVEDVTPDVTQKGLVMHQTFEHLLQFENYEGDVAKLPYRQASMEEIMKIFQKAVEENHLTAEAAKKYKLKKGIKRWLSFKHDYMDKRGHIFYAEKKYEEYLFGETKTTAILDLVEDNGDGTYNIYDYKTPQKVNLKLYEEQLMTYAYMMAVVKGIIPLNSEDYDKVAEHFKLYVFFPLLDADHEDYGPSLKQVKFTGAKVKNTIEHLKEVCSQIDAFDFTKPAEALMPPKVEFTCNWCNFCGAKPNPGIGFEGCPITSFAGFLQKTEFKKEEYKKEEKK